MFINCKSCICGKETAWKGMFKAMKKAKCIDKGVHEGGDHGKEFMPEYLKFWKDNLL